ncbi:DNA polymerase beta superfamily protein [Sebaldella sp. S0638]|uniref:nucleotidyltransferase domain-containing protein n=1 Tax=Sebaldella sp. S0638 TaxID=2957809 RepID=UPI0020A0A37F|nr:nucleotidyltransferase domain-containing protein [Sebaldella sp. S0638]
MSDNEKELITEELLALEKKENIKILFAVESGSRAWGFESKDSDYDVRFVYVRPLEWYMSISRRKDTLEVMINEDLDFAGWDLNKALELLAKSNPPLGEWLNSSIVYMNRDNSISEFSELFDKYLRENALVYHYLSMASKDIETLREKKEIKLKKYFYMLRSLLASKWVMVYHEKPPILLSKLLTLTENKEVLNETGKLLEMKKAGNEGTKIIGNEIINEFIFDTKKEVEEMVKNVSNSKNTDLKFLDRFFLDKVLYYEKM